MAEGARPRHIEAEVPERTEQMHEKSLLQGRDILKVADPKERRRWIDKEGRDWSGAFGQDPLAQIQEQEKSGKKESGQEDGLMHLPDDDSHSDTSDSSNEHEQDHKHGDTANAIVDPSNPIASNPVSNQDTQATPNNGTPPSSSYTQRTSTGTSQTSTINTVDTASSSTTSKRAAKRSEQRQQRGLMQWKPARNAQFAKDEAKYAFRKVRQHFSGDLSGREPDIETETGS